MYLQIVPTEDGPTIIKWIFNSVEINELNFKIEDISS